MAAELPDKVWDEVSAAVPYEAISTAIRMTNPEWHVTSLIQRAVETAAEVLRKEGW